MLDHDERGVELLLHPQDERAERLRLALGDAGGGLVQADHAGRHGEHGGKLDDAAGAGRQLGDEPVGVAAETEEVDQLAGFLALGALDSIDGSQSNEPQNDDRRRASSASSTVSRTVSSGIETGGLEGAAEPDPGALVGALLAHVPAEQHHRAATRHEATDRVQQASTSRRRCCR